MKGDRVRFSFKRFTVMQSDCAMKVGTDGVLIGAWAQGAPRILDVGTAAGLLPHDGSALRRGLRCGA